jgi:hypothetical protein
LFLVCSIYTIAYNIRIGNYGSIVVGILNFFCSKVLKGLHRVVLELNHANICITKQYYQVNVCSMTQSKVWDRIINTLDEEYFALEKLLTHLFALGEAVELKAHNRAKTFQSQI